MPQPNPPPLISKVQVGAIAVVCLVISAICAIFYPEHESVQGSTMRVGIVMGALFFVLPKAGDRARWDRLLPFFVGTVLLIAFSKKMIVAILPMLISIGVVVYTLRPRGKFRPPRD